MRCYTGTMKNKYQRASLAGIPGRIRTGVYRLLSKNWFFYVIVGLLVLQSLWIALTARYPQAFDENFHLGLIQLHAQQWLPFFTSHPPGAEVYGAVERDPSYFYHYMLSIPYRLLEELTASLATQVIVLRLVNLAVFVGGLFVFRKLLLELGLSRRMMHVSLLFFVLIPIVPLLAAHINYDNLIFLLTGMLLLYFVRYLKAVREQKHINIMLLLTILLLVLLSSIVKYTSTPLSVPLVIILAIMTVVWLRESKTSLRGALVWPRKAVLIVLSALILLFGVLVAERYATNIVQYQNVQPDCADVIGVDRCMSYSPWARDYRYAQQIPEPTTSQILHYPIDWTDQMMWETMFTVTGWFRDNGTVHYVAADPLAPADKVSWLVFWSALILLVFFWRRLWSMPYLRLILLAVIFYALALFLKNFAMFLHSGKPVAIHGRYLIPLFPVIFVSVALLCSWFLDKIRLPKAKTWLFIATLLVFIHGAGITVWLMRSDSRWYWQQSEAAQNFNETAKDILDPVIVE